MAVSNGQIANATTFNNAFISRTSDSSTTGRIDLNNAVAASGPNVTNVQREINSLNSFTGRASGSVFNAVPTWTSNQVGPSTDNLFDRVDALDDKQNGSTGHNHDGTAGNGPPLSLVTATTGTLPITRGGTGQITAAAAFDALSPLTTVGDLVAFNGANTRLPVGTDGYVLTADSGAATGLIWALPSAAAASGQWIKYTFAYTDFSIGSLSLGLAVVNLAAGQTVEGVIVKHSVAFSGGFITAIVADIGITGDLERYVSDFDVFQAVSNTARDITQTMDVPDFSGTEDVIITLTSVGGNLNTLAAGSVDVWLKIATLP